MTQGRDKFMSLENFLKFRLLQLHFLPAWHIIVHWDNLFGLSYYKIQVATQYFPVMDKDDCVTPLYPYFGMLTHGRFHLWWTHVKRSGIATQLSIISQIMGDFKKRWSLINGHHTKYGIQYHTIFYAIVVTFLTTLLMNTFTNIVMDDWNLDEIHANH